MPFPAPNIGSRPEALSLATWAGRRRVLASGLNVMRRISRKVLDAGRTGGQNGQHEKNTWITPNRLHGPESCFRKAQAGSLSRFLFQLRAVFVFGEMSYETHDQPSKQQLRTAGPGGQGRPGLRASRFLAGRIGGGHLRPRTSTVWLRRVAATVPSGGRRCGKAITRSTGRAEDRGPGPWAG